MGLFFCCRNLSAGFKPVAITCNPAGIRIVCRYAQEFRRNSRIRKKVYKPQIREAIYYGLDLLLEKLVEHTDKESKVKLDAQNKGQSVPIYQHYQDQRLKVKKN